MDQIIDGRYQLLKRLGDDDTSALYVASDLQTGRVACLRLWSLEPSAVDRLVETPGRGPQTASTSNPHVVTPYDWGVDRDLVYLARDYVSGRSLTDVVEHEGPLAVPLAVSYGAQIAEAVAAAHAAGQPHGRIRSSQVFVGDDGVIRVVGFEEASILAPIPSRPIRGFAAPSAKASPEAVDSEFNQER
ncbi:MAG TPA: hypothetical protein VKT80_17005, partial [Chloroflexota bacterium]|nr:hypothetical protein [Chloroflexota bacterium]